MDVTVLLCRCVCVCACVCVWVRNCVTLDEEGEDKIRKKKTRKKIPPSATYMAVGVWNSKLPPATSNA